MVDSEHDPTARQALPAGHDEESPYTDIDLNDLPQWWRRNIEEFQAYQLRSYKPPRFADGELVPSLIAELEEELDVSIRLRVIDPQEGQSWEVLVDNDPIATVERFRHSKGCSVCDVESKFFEQLIVESIRN
jgi:hypothetical protein